MDAVQFRPDPMNADAVWHIPPDGKVRFRVRYLVLTAHLLVPMTLTAALGTIGFSTPDGTAIAHVWPAAALQVCMSAWFGIYGAIAGTLGPMLGNGLLGQSAFQFMPANALQSCLLGLWFRWRRLDPRLRSRRDWVGVLLIGCVLSNALGAGLGLTETWLRGLGDPAKSAQAGYWIGKYLNWFLGNTAPCLLLVPLMFRALSPVLVRSPFFCQGFLGGFERSSGKRLGKRWADLPMTAKVMALLVVGGILPMSLVGGWTLIVAVKEANQLAADTNAEFARTMRSNIDRYDLMLRHWAEGIDRDGLRGDALDQRVRQLQETSKAFEHLHVEDLADVVARLGSDALRETKLHVVFFEEGPAGEVRNPGNLWGFARLKPAADGTRRVLIGKIAWEAGTPFYSQWAAFEAILVYDQHGNVLYRAAPPDLDNWQPDLDALSAERVVIQHGRRRWHLAMAEIPRLRMRFLTLTPVRAGIAAVLSTMPKGAVVLIHIVIFASLIFGGAMAQRISGRVLTIAEHVRNAGGQPVPLEIPVTGADELGYLAGTLNRISTELAENVRRLRRETAEKERLAAEMELAREVQLQTLPEHPPEVAGYEFAAACRPAREVGGDFFDFFSNAGGCVVMLVGDAVGKGLRAAMFTTETHGLAHAAALEDAAPDEILYHINAAMVSARGPSHNFVTLFCAVLEPAEHAFRYASAGHNPPLLLRNGRTEQLHLGSLPLAILPETRYETHTVFMVPGDTIVMYTDGVTEARNPGDQLFEMHRLEAVIRRHAGASALEIHDAILNAVHEFADGAEQSDDITLLVIRRTE